MAEYKHSSVPAGFKEIPGYDGRYFINEKGEVWSAFKKGLMSPQTDATHPYPWVLLRENGRSQPRTVYYLMRLTWMPSAPGKVGNKRGEWCVNHVDGNKLNSHISNLEWTTAEDNVRHAWDTGLNMTTTGENAKNAKFTSDQVRRIRLRLINGEKVKAIAKEFNAGESLIKKIQQFVSWKHQDHDLVDGLMKVCSSQWLRVMKTKLETGERMEECCNDYTKIKRNWAECRRIGYHLTASFDGWQNTANLAICRDALKNGVNVAAAFNLKKGQDLPTLAEVSTIVGGNSLTFLPVCDGDLTDFRPSDPTGGHIIGLRFKLPHGIAYTDAEKSAFCM